MAEGGKGLTPLALVPSDEGGYAYFGPTGRTFRLSPAQYRHALGMAGRPDPGNQDPLLAVIMEGQRTEAHLSEFALPCPPQAGSLIAMLLVIAAGASGWLIAAVTGWSGLHSLLRPSMAWLWIVPAAVGATLLHEWGHALALRSIGGRSGRTLLRWGFPLLVTEVGPIRLLSARKRPWVVGAGLLVEASLLGVAMAAHSVGIVRGLATGIIAFESLSLPLSLLPWRGSDLFRLLHWDEI